MRRNRRSFLCAVCWIVLLCISLAGQGGAVQAQPGQIEREAGIDSIWFVEWVDLARSFSLLGQRSLVLDSSGNPHIAYGNNGLYYAHYDGAVWNTELVDRTPGLGQYSSLALDASDLPHISYYDDQNGDMRYAHYDGFNWQVTVVDAGAGSC